MKNDLLRIMRTMSRIGLGTSGPAFKFQVERLAKALRNEGEHREAEALEDLLKSEESESKLRPSRLVQSAAALPGEVLSSRVVPPVDRETSAPLCEIHFPAENPISPVLPQNLADAVDRIIEEWAHVEQLQAIGAAPPRTCMLFGNPGTGKTRLAYYMGDRLGLPVVLARLDGLISSFLGTTARNIGILFDFANRYRCLLLLDEFDALAKLRDDPQEVGEIKRVVNTLLQNIDKRTGIGFTMAITNHEGLLDPAVWRRFEIRVQIPVPERRERELILEHYIAPLPIDPVMLRFLSWVTEGSTGSDLEALVRSLKRYTTIHSKGDFALIDGLRAYAVTNATAGQEQRLALVATPPQEIARKLMASPEIGLTQQEVGTVLGKDQATISRWLRADNSAERTMAHAE
ncbi:MAG: ATP-binding protein [Terracidiphilus sp.]